jgi:uncharacterized protein with HEPN domain
MPSPSTLDKDRQFIKDIIDVASKAASYTRDYSEEEFALDEIRCLAVTRLVEIAGEAASRISFETKSKFPEIPWREMSDARNKAIHGYAEVDYLVIYSIATKYLPEVAGRLTGISI